MAKIETIDKSIADGIAQLRGKDIESAWDRLNRQEPQCGFGEMGICCRNCFMGPCRIDPFGEGPQLGVCGASAEVIAARNFTRMIAAGAAAHSDHGRDVALTLLAAARGETKDYKVKDEIKLVKTAKILGIPTENKNVAELAEKVALAALAQFGQQEGEIGFIKTAPLKTRERWRKLGIIPRGIDREIVEIMHRTHMGVDQDAENILLHGSRAALGDGWGGSMIATELQDIMFGTPKPVRSSVNLGVLKEDNVNIIVHGHEPVLSELIVVASKNPELLKMCREKGAKGITIAGICCTANEILIRHGIPVAGTFLLQELAIATGAVEAMVVDVQCIMSSLASISSCFHTKLITTSPKGRMPGALHIEFHEQDALNIAGQIVKEAIENFPKRKGAVNIPKDKPVPFIAGFSHETINYMLGGTFRASYRPLNDNIINGRIRGVAGVVGCNNPKTTLDDIHVKLVKDLIAHDILVVQTGCSALACAKQGLMTPEAAMKYAGPGLKEVCETVGIPPVLHSGSCVDNSRILVACSEMIKEGGLGEDICDLPVAGAAPEWMSEKAIAIGEYVVASGIFTVFGVGFPIIGSKKVCDILFNKYNDKHGAAWAVEPDPLKMSELIRNHIEKKRDALGINVRHERKLFDMEERRKLEV